MNPAIHKKDNTSWTCEVYAKDENLVQHLKINQCKPLTRQTRKEKTNDHLINAGEGVEKREHFCTVGGNVNWYSHYGEQYGGPLKN